ncbi:hypothetical protein RB600_003861 [Gaeumannomyces tritici]
MHISIRSKMIARITATVLLQLLLLPLAMGKASPPPPWKAPSPDDRRGPCPMMNSLANHGLIPHSGLNVSGDELRAGFVAGTNVDSPVLDGFIRAALSVSTTGVPGTLNLDDLASPVTEHDGSLSRPDRHGGGDVLAFNASVWAETIAGHFVDPVVTLEQAAAARAHRLCAAAAANSEFHLSDLQMELSFTETTIYMLFMGRGTQGTARRDFVKVLFEQERLPYLEGWTRPDEAVTWEQIQGLMARLKAATPEPCSPEGLSKHRKQELR